jgi:hypothetical protein
MSNKSLINYKLFQNRRNFNPLSLFAKNKDLTYEEFVAFLQSKMVDSPGIAYYERVKTAFLNSTKTATDVVVAEVAVPVVAEANVEVKALSRKNKKSRKSKRTELPVKQVDLVDSTLADKDDKDEKDSTE